jgi:hypothetical protein
MATLSLSPSVFAAIRARNTQWLDTSCDLYLCQAAVTIEQLAYPWSATPFREPRETKPLRGLAALLDALDHCAVDASGDAMRALLKIVAGCDVSSGGPELSFLGVRERCRGFVSAGGLAPLAGALVRAIACLQSPPLDDDAVDAVVARVAAGVTLMTWVLSLNLHDAEFCACTAHFFVDSSRCALLLALVELLQVATSRPHLRFPLRSSALLLRLVLRVSVLGHGASATSVQCDDPAADELTARDHGSPTRPGVCSCASDSSCGVWSQYAAGCVFRVLKSEALEQCVVDLLVLLLASAPNLKSYSGRVNLYAELDAEHIARQDLFGLRSSAISLGGTQPMAPRESPPSSLLASSRARHRDIISWACAEVLLMILKFARLSGDKETALVSGVLRRDNGPLLILKYLSQEILGYLSDVDETARLGVQAIDVLLDRAAAFADAPWGATQPGERADIPLPPAAASESPYRSLYVLRFARPSDTSVENATGIAVASESLSRREDCALPLDASSPVPVSETSRPSLDTFASPQPGLTESAVGLEGTARGLQVPSRGSLAELTHDEGPTGPEHAAVVFSTIVLATAAGLIDISSASLRVDSSTSMTTPGLCRSSSHANGYMAADESPATSAGAATMAGISVLSPASCAAGHGSESRNEALLGGHRLLSTEYDRLLLSLENSVVKQDLGPQTEGADSTACSHCQCHRRPVSVPQRAAVTDDTMLALEEHAGTSMAASCQRRKEEPGLNQTSRAVSFVGPPVIPLSGRPVSHRRLGTLCALLRVLCELELLNPSQVSADLVAFKSWVVLSRAIATGVVPLVYYALVLLRPQLPLLPIWARNNTKIVAAATRLLGPAQNRGTRTKRVDTSEDATRRLEQQLASTPCSDEVLLPLTEREQRALSLILVPRDLRTSTSFSAADGSL